MAYVPTPLIAAKLCTGSDIRCLMLMRHLAATGHSGTDMDATTEGLTAYIRDPRGHLPFHPDVEERASDAVSLALLRAADLDPAALSSLHYVLRGRAYGAPYGFTDDPSGSITLNVTNDMTKGLRPTPEQRGWLSITMMLAPGIWWGTGRRGETSGIRIRGLARTIAQTYVGRALADLVRHPVLDQHDCRILDWVDVDDGAGFRLSPPHIETYRRETTT